MRKRHKKFKNKPLSELLEKWAEKHDLKQQEKKDKQNNFYYHR